MCPLKSFGGSSAVCWGVRCQWWDRVERRCYVETLAIGLWRLSTKLPGEVIDGSWKIAEAVKGSRG